MGPVRMDFETARRNMVDSQVRPNDVTAPEIVAAILATPRERFVPKSRQALAYSETEIETSPGRALWIPRDFAKLVSAAAPEPSDVALIVGAGAGYETAVLSHLTAMAIGLEADADLVSRTSDLLLELGIDRAVIVEGDLGAGLPDQAPFDIIFINGMVETVPDAWREQLSEGGRLVLVEALDADLGRAKVYTRSGDAVSARGVFDATPPIFAQFDRAPGFVF